MDDNDKLMDDDQLIAALRNGLDAVDPPPASLHAKAIEAGRWPNSAAVEARVRDGGDLASAGMRSADATSDEVETIRDLSFETDEHNIDVTLDFEAAADATEISLIVTPPVAHVTIVSPFGAPQTISLDNGGRATMRSEYLALAIELTSGSGDTVRTPLIRLS